MRAIKNAKEQKCNQHYINIWNNTKSTRKRSGEARPHFLSATHNYCWFLFTENWLHNHV